MPTVGGALTAAARLTALAGLVGVLRQRRELARPPGGAAGPDPVAALERLARWVPQRPRTLLGRTLAATWASPLTVVGLAVAVASGARPRWDDARGCLVAVGTRGASRRALTFVGADANAVGQVVLARSAGPSPTLLAHEAVHVRQAERLGPLLVPCYAVLGALRGYRAHPLERAARLGAARAAGPPVSPSDGTA